VYGARDQIRTGDPHVGKEMLALISLRIFYRSGHIVSFRSIVGEAVEVLGAMAKDLGRVVERLRLDDQPARRCSRKGQALDQECH